MIDYQDIKSSDIEHAINEYVHNEFKRKILKRRLIDGVTFDKIAEEFDRTPRQIRNIVYKDGDRVLNKIISTY